MLAFVILLFTLLVVANAYWIKRQEDEQLSAEEQWRKQNGIKRK